MNLSILTPAQLRKAASIKEQIENLHKQLTALTGISAPSQSTKPAKRKMSASAKAKIRAAQKARWAKVKAAKANPAKPAKRKMSAAAKAKLAALAKARWAKIKAAGKKTL